MLHVYLFGGLSLQHNDTPLATPSSLAARSLLAYLCMHQERTHTRALLAGLLWPDLPEETARRRLSHALWELRQALDALPGEESYFVTTQKHVGFNPQVSCWIDVRQFEHLVDNSGKDDASLPALRDAVELYRDDFMAGYYDDWVLLERERLRDRYLDTLDELIRRCKARGLYEEALTYAGRLAQHDPLREKAHREVIRLYHLLGRPHEAIQQYERYRDVLAEELNAEPSPAMQSLYREVRSRLTSDDRRHWPTPTPSQSPLLEGKEVVPFVGRKQERIALVHALEQTLDRCGGIVFVEGEPGVGKTRLLNIMRDDASWRGIRTLWGRARAGDDSSPYGAVQDALTRDLSPLRVRRLVDLLDVVWLRELVRLIPSVSDWVPELPPPADLPPDQEQERLLEAIVQVLLTLERFSPLLLVIDDVQWADEGTLRVMSRLVSHVQDRQLLIAAGYRSEVTRAKKEVWKTIRTLDRTAGRARVVLERLNSDEATELTRRSLGLPNRAPHFETRLYRESGGNPLFLLETLRALRDEGLLYRDEAGRWSTPWDESTDVYEELPVAPALRDVVESRLEQLALWSRRILNLAAVLGDDVELDWLLRGSDADEAVVLAAVDDLIQRGLLVKTGDGDRYRFSHNQIQTFAYETIESDERRRLHRRAGAALEADAPDRVEALARHFYRGHVWDKAVEYLLRAAERAKDVYATETALAYCERALDILDTHAPADGLRSAKLRYDLLDIRRYVAWAAGDVDQQVADLETLRRLAERLEDPERIVAVLNQYALFLYEQDEHEPARDRAEVAFSLAHEHGLTRQAARARQYIGQSYYRCDHYHRAEEELLQSLEQWQNVDNSVLERATVHVRLAQVYQKRGMIDCAESHCETALSLAEPSQDPYVLFHIYNQLALAASTRGDYDASISFERAGLDQARTAGFRHNEAVLLSNLGISYWAVRDYGESVMCMRKGLAIYRELDNRRGVAVSLENLAHLYREIGQYERAHAAVEEGLKLAASLDHPYLNTLLLCNQGRLHLVQDDLEGAQQAFAEAHRISKDVQVPYITGQVQFCLGLYEFARDNPSVAAQHLQRAEDAFTEGDAVDWVALVQSYRAVCYLDLERPEDAMRLSSEAIGALQDKAGGEEILGIYRNHWHVMRTTGHETDALSTLETAYDELQTQRETLPDDWQRAFMEQVPVHREIAKAYAEWQTRQRAGQVTVRLPHIDAPLGRPLRDDEWVEVTWTVEKREDEDVAGKKARRQHRILRLLREAEAQNAAPRVADLAEVLDVSVKTIKRDLAALRKTGREVQTRGSR